MAPKHSSFKQQGKSKQHCPACKKSFTKLGLHLQKSSNPACKNITMSSSTIPPSLVSLCSIVNHRGNQSHSSSPPFDDNSSVYVNAEDQSVDGISLLNSSEADLDNYNDDIDDDSDRNMLEADDTLDDCDEDPAISVLSPLCSNHLGFELLSPKLMSCLRIMAFCDDNGCPRIFYDQLITLIENEVIHNKLDLSTHAYRRKTLLRHVENKSPASPPVMETIALENTSTTPNASASNAQSRNFHDPINYIRGPRDSVALYRYDFLPQLFDILNDVNIFGYLHNLDVNKGPGADPFAMFRRDDGLLYEINSGSCYKAAYASMIKNPTKEFLLPIIMYLDKTACDRFGRNALEPVLISTSVISLDARQSNNAWRVLGYLPDMSAKSSAQNTTSNSKMPGSNQRNYHKCLERILSSLATAQGNNIHFKLRLGNHRKLVTLRIPLLMVINDGKSADMLCNRYGGFNELHRISRGCDSIRKDCSKQVFTCTYLRDADIAKLQDDALPNQTSDHTVASPQVVAQRKRRQLTAVDKLKSLSMHVCHNAFRAIHFGGDKRGIFGANPIDLMHAFNEGVLKYVLSIIFDSMGASRKSSLDNLVDAVFRQQKSSVRKDLPRTNFVKGFTNLTQITATEWIGVCFTTMIVSMLSSGKAILLGCVSGVGLNEDDTDSESDDSTTEDDAGGVPQRNNPKTSKRLRCSLLDLQELLQLMLCFHAWSKSKEAFDPTQNGIKQMKRALSIMLNKIKLWVPRLDGMGWNIQKFHDISHLIDDMARYGSPSNFDAGQGERSLKHFAKHPGRTSQKRDGLFAKQVANRIHESDNVRRVLRQSSPHHSLLPLPCLVGNSPDKRSTRFVGAAPNYSILANGSAHMSKWNGTVSSNVIFEVHPVIQQWFRKDMMNRKYNAVISCWTEYQKNGATFRAHPSYRSQSPWYDWCYVKFTNDDMEEDDDESLVSQQSSLTFFPAKLLCFYNDPVTNAAMALVHTCNNKNSAEDGNAVICEEWFLEYNRDGNVHRPVFRDVPVESLDEPIFAIQEIPGLRESICNVASLNDFNRCIVIKNRESHWAQAFL